MTWEEVLEHEPHIREVAKKWSMKVSDPERYEDIVHDLMIYCVEKVDLSGALDKVNYLKGACWNASHMLLLSSQKLAERRTVSLDTYESDKGVQLDDRGMVRYPSKMQFDEESFD